MIQTIQNKHNKSPYQVWILIDDESSKINSTREFNLQNSHINFNGNSPDITKKLVRKFLEHLLDVRRRCEQEEAVTSQGGPASLGSAAGRGGRVGASSLKKMGSNSAVFSKLVSQPIFVFFVTASSNVQTPQKFSGTSRIRAS